MVVAKKSKTTNFAIANGNSRERIGAKPDQSGEISFSRSALKSKGVSGFFLSLGSLVIEDFSSYDNKISSKCVNTTIVV